MGQKFQSNKFTVYCNALNPEKKIPTTCARLLEVHFLRHKTIIQVIVSNM